MSNLFRLNKSDFTKGAVSAIFAAVICSLYSVASTPDFNVFALDIQTTLTTVTNAAVYAFIGYIGKNFVSDDQGRVFGRIG